MLIRDADSRRDAAACAEIYAPYVRDTPISLEERAPTAQEIAAQAAASRRLSASRISMGSNVSGR